nr:hypothetical protein BaRGS_034628 [Batillaria attramentaria]
MTDLCWRCQNNTTRIFRSANLTDEEKNDLLLEQQRHLSQVDAERKYYKDLVEQSKVTQVNFLVDESVNVSKGSIAVISYLHYYFEHFGMGEKRVQLHCDNCSGQNKNNFLIWVVEESTAESRINIPQLVGHEDGTVVVPTFDWQNFLSPAFRRMPGVLQYSHFRVTRERPGVLFYRSSLAEDEQSRMLIKSAAAFDALPDMPPVLPAPGLSYERQAYLYNQIREFVCEEQRDVVCPLPEINCALCYLCVLAVKSFFKVTVVLF